MEKDIEVFMIPAPSFSDLENPGGILLGEATNLGEISGMWI